MRDRLQVTSGSARLNVRCLSVLLLVALVMPLAIAAAAPKAPPARRSAAPFDVTTLNGQRVTLEGLRGKVVILDFWATWCPPCRMEIPHFKALYAKYHPKLEILAISLDEEGERVVAPFVRKQGITYPVAIGQDRLVSAYGGIRGIPTTFVIDRQGRIVKKYIGYKALEVFEKDIETLLAEP